MRLTAAIAVVVLSGVTLLAQKAKDPTLYAPPTPRALGHNHSVVAPPPATSSSASSAAELARIEQQTVRVRSNRAAAHPPSTNVTTTPALDLGKNRPIRAGRPIMSTKPNSH